MRCRKNIKRLSLEEKKRFVLAVVGLKARDSLLHPGAQSRYDDYVEVHRNAMDAMPSWGHGDSAFLPWHRELLYRFEEDLRSIDPSVTIPYWDWTREQNSSDSGFPFTHDFIGVDGNNAAQSRVERDPVYQNASPYPYPFDPLAWTIVVIDGFEPGFLTRDFHSRSDAPDLPENDTVVTGVNSTFREAIGAGSYLSLRARSEDIHNLVHRWVNGNMGTASSPNDPVFFFHHAAIDRMWTLWRDTHPALTPYVNTSGANGHVANQNMIFNFPGDPAPWVGTATPNSLVNGHATHGESIWYDTDRPEIVLESGPTLAFGDVPQGLTTYRAVNFRVSTFRQVRFRITGQPTGNFGLTLLGTEFILEPTYGPAPLTALVWVQFLAQGTAVQASQVVIEAYLIDEEGYYAATPGGEYVLGTFTVDLSANVVPLESNSVVLVLDRSGSMAAAAGGSSTRSSLLKDAVGVFHALLRPNDEIGIVSFDDQVETPLPLTTQSSGLGNLLTTSHALDPRGLTGIGLGIEAASTMLATASHPNRSMLVLTDGNENVHPYVDELPAGTLTSRTYAIGFGLQGDVSDPVLNRITHNTGGDLVITGSLVADAEQFLLTKYFLQVLAGVTNANVILDPQGELAWGTRHEIPFAVAETDVSIDAIALCAFAPYLDFELVTPGGARITAGDPGANGAFTTGPDVAFFRLGLPALPADAASSHAGTWKMVLQLRKPEEIEKLSAKHRKAFAEKLAAIRQTLPYSCLVHTRSNLQLRATLRTPSLDPGTNLELTALLDEYGVPFPGGASVRGELSRPDGTSATVALVAAEPGRYVATIPTSTAGIYRVRVVAEGHTSGGNAFTREKTLTAGVFAGASTSATRPDGMSEELCHLLKCSLEKGLDARAVKDLEKRGYNISVIARCIEQLCADRRPRERKVEVTTQRPPKKAELLSAKKQFRSAATASRLPEPERKLRTETLEERHVRQARLAERRAAMEMFPPVSPDDQGGGHGGHGGHGDHGGHDHHDEHVERPTRSRARGSKSQKSTRAVRKR